MTTFSPSAPEDVLSTVQWAAAEELPLEIVGHGSKRGIGRPVDAPHTLDLSRLVGVTLYEPAELVLSARAGTALSEIRRLLAANHQELAFEPIDYGPLLGGVPEKGTIGGALAANLSGPRRIKAGAARDHVLGVEAVSGRGEAFKSGGRVVKNVTGYDLSKGMAGSWGTLAVLTSVTFKVLPSAETEATLLLRNVTDAQAAAATAAALGSSAEASGAAHLPAPLVGRVLGGSLGERAATAIRIEGVGPSVAYRLERLRDLLNESAPVQEELIAEGSRRLWRDIRDCVPFADGSERPVWRLSVTPSEGWRVVDDLRRSTGAEAFYDWQGGLVWLRMQTDPRAGEVRRVVRAFGGGHATLVRASLAQRASTDVFEPQLPALAALSARFRQGFDPKGILNPGRMREATANATPRAAAG